MCFPLTKISRSRPFENIFFTPHDHCPILPTENDRYPIWPTSLDRFDPKNHVPPIHRSDRAVQALGAQLVVCKGTQELWDDEIRLGTVIPFPRNRGGCRGFIYIYTCLGPFIYGVINFGMRVLGVVLWDLNTFSKYISSTRIGTSASKAKKPCKKLPMVIYCQWLCGKIYSWNQVLYIVYHLS